MYKREVLEKVGFFNEKLLRTEDNEFHYRIRKAGYKLCYDDDIISYQHTRNSLSKMIKQKKANGMWIGLTTVVSIFAALLTIESLFPIIGNHQPVQLLPLSSSPSLVWYPSLNLS